MSLFLVIDHMNLVYTVATDYFIQYINVDYVIKDCLMPCYGSLVAQWG